MTTEKSSHDTAIPCPRLRVMVGCAGAIRAVSFVCRPASVQGDASDFFVGSAKIKMTCNTCNKCCIFCNVECRIGVQGGRHGADWIGYNI